MGFIAKIFGGGSQDIPEYKETPPPTITSTEDVQGGADRAAEEARRRASAGQAGNVNRTTTGLGSSSGSTTLGL